MKQKGIIDKELIKNVVKPANEGARALLQLHNPLLSITLP